MDVTVKALPGRIPWSEELEEESIAMWTILPPHVFSAFRRKLGLQGQPEPEAAPDEDENAIRQEADDIAAVIGGYYIRRRKR